MLTEAEERFIERVLEAGEAVEQDTFELMIEDGVPADAFISAVTDYNTGAVLETLAEKGLAYTETVEETIHYNGGVSGPPVEPIRFEDTGFKTIDRQYIHFTEKLREHYRDRKPQ